MQGLTFDPGQGRVLLLVIYIHHFFILRSHCCIDFQEGEEEEAE